MTRDLLLMHGTARRRGEHYHVLSILAPTCYAVVLRLSHQIVKLTSIICWLDEFRFAFPAQSACCARKTTDHLRYPGAPDLKFNWFNNGLDGVVDLNTKAWGKETMMLRRRTHGGMFIQQIKSIVCQWDVDGYNLHACINIYCLKDCAEGCRRRDIWRT